MATAPSIVVICGEEEYQKSVALKQVLDTLLPPPTERLLALAEYDGTRAEDQGGPGLVPVLQDLATLPFLAPRRVVLIRAADQFISAHREGLEKYLDRPSATGTLVLECRSLPKTTRLYKAAAATGGQIIECRKLAGRALIEFIVSVAAARKKTITGAAAARLIDLVGHEAALLAAEVDKLSLYAAERTEVTEQDVSDLVGQSREEKIFAALDAAALGRLPDALRLWHQVLATDPEAAFKAVGGVAFKLRQWLTAHRRCAEGARIAEVAGGVMMWGRERELEALLGRCSPLLLRRVLAALANLDSQAKAGLRSIGTGVEMLFLGLASPASQ